MGNSSEGDDLLNEVSVFIENRENVSFVGNWMLLVNYDQVPHYHPFTLFLDVSLYSTCTSTYSGTFLLRDRKEVS